VSRSGYIDDIDDWQMIKWRGQVASAIRGRRGQKFLTDLYNALEALPEKRLIKHELKDETGEVCAIGALGMAITYLTFLALAGYAWGGVTGRDQCDLISDSRAENLFSSSERWTSLNFQSVHSSASKAKERITHPMNATHFCQDGFSGKMNCDPLRTSCCTLSIGSVHLAGTLFSSLNDSKPSSSTPTRTNAPAISRQYSSVSLWPINEEMESIKRIERFHRIMRWVTGCLVLVLVFGWFMQKR
jgi:hypothetical protein